MNEAEERIIEEKRQKGVLAAQVLDNPEYQYAIKKTKSDIFELWASTKWYEHRKRNEFWRMYRAAEQIESNLKKTLNRAKLALNQ